MGRKQLDRSAVGRALLVGAAMLATYAPVSAQLAEAPPAAAAFAVVDSSRPSRVVPPTPSPLETPFVLSQLRYDRVLNARLESRFAIKRLFREKGIRYPASEIFLRIFKRERLLEVWVRSADMEKFALLKAYDICALAGELGPKRRQGDMQVPEGFYYIDHFNPVSDYYLSLHVDYPNRSDALLGDTMSLGGDIFIHGGCNSEGCIAVTNEGIKELYWLSVEARGLGQQRIPVHIFPARLTDVDLPLLTRAFEGRPALTKFWRSLKPGFDYFDRQLRVPRMSVDAQGLYRVAGEEKFDAPMPAGVPTRTGPVPLGRPVELPGGGPVPLGRPVAAPADTSAAPLGTPAATPNVETVTPAPQTAQPASARPATERPASGRTPSRGARKPPVPLGTPVGGQPAPADTPGAEPKRPVPLGKPVGGR